MVTTTEPKTRGTWDELRMHPGTLTVMVATGQARIVGKDKRGRRIYVLKRPKARIA